MQSFIVGSVSGVALRIHPCNAGLHPGVFVVSLYYSLSDGSQRQNCFVSPIRGTPRMQDHGRSRTMRLRRQHVSSVEVELRARQSLLSGFKGKSKKRRPHLGSHTRYRPWSVRLRNRERTIVVGGVIPRTVLLYGLVPPVWRRQNEGLLSVPG